MINYAPVKRPAPIVFAKKGDQMMGTESILKVFKRMGEDFFWVTIDNCVQGSYPELSDAMNRFEQLKASKGFA